MRIDVGEALSLRKQRLCHEIDEAADRKRAEYITLQPGMVGVYMLKKAEAEHIMANVSYEGGEYVTSVSPGEVPNIAIEANDLDLSLYGAAMVVLQKAAEWAFVSALIEQKRLAHKRAVMSSTTIQTTQEAALVDWDIGV